MTSEKTAPALAFCTIEKGHETVFFHTYSDPEVAIPVFRVQARELSLEEKKRLWQLHCSSYWAGHRDGEKAKIQEFRKLLGIQTVKVTVED